MSVSIVKPRSAEALAPPSSVCTAALAVAVLVVSFGNSVFAVLTGIEVSAERIDKRRCVKPNGPPGSSCPTVGKPSSGELPLVEVVATKGPRGDLRPALQILRRVQRTIVLLLADDPELRARTGTASDHATAIRDVFTALQQDQAPGV